MNVSGFFRPQLRHCLITGSDVPRWLRRHPRFAYIKAVVLSTPEWCDREAVKALRAEARRLTAVTGVRHVLDHIVPVNHPDVCGLTVPCNLQIITARQNAYKSNKWNPWQLDLPLREL